MFELKDKLTFKDENGKFQSGKFKLRLEKDFLHYESDLIKSPRISSHTLVDMLGFNKYGSSGKTILSMFGLVKKSDMDPYQEHKGGMVEVFAKRYLEKKYGDRANVQAFTVSQFTNFNQFPEEAPFSGVLDLQLLFRTSEKMTVEVKAKEMKDYDAIARLNMFPKEQIVQGANQAVLAKTDRYMMLWGFLTPAFSKLIKELTKVHKFKKKITDSSGEVKEVILEESLWIWGSDYERAVNDLEITNDQVLFYAKEFDVDPRMIKAYREKALGLYNDFFINRRIDKKLFKADELRMLKAHLLKPKQP